MWVSGSLNPSKMALVDLDFRAFQLELNVFAQIASQVAHQTGELGEETTHRLHARLSDQFLQFGGDQTDALRAGADTAVVGA